MILCLICPSGNLLSAKKELIVVTEAFAITVWEQPEEEMAEGKCNVMCRTHQLESGQCSFGGI